MKYEQPYGVSDPNAAYINGNPSTGTMGSIPPAASIENPQREIVNFITDSGIAPSDADLHQLAKSVQNGKVNYSADSGPANLILVTVTPAVTALTVGLRFIVKVANANSSAVVVSVNGLAGVPLVHRDGTPMGAYELVVSSMIEIVYDGANFQLVAGGSGSGSGQLIFMTAPKDFYVNNSTGNDTLYDGTSATIGTGTVGPFKTIQKAVSTLAKYNLGGWSFNIHVADGSYYNSTSIGLPLPNGSGQVQLIGNLSNPMAVQVYNTGTGSTLVAQFGGTYYIQGFDFRATAPTVPLTDNGNCIWSLGNSVIAIANCNFNVCTGAHMCAQGGQIEIFGPTTITGSAAQHWYVGLNGIIGVNTNPAVPVTFNAAITISSAFILATTGGQAKAWYLGFPNSAGNCNGSKYNATGNGVVDSKGQGVSFLPGTVAGSLATGGQYL
jgi:hypothetical protein